MSVAPDGKEPEDATLISSDEDSEDRK